MAIDQNALLQAILNPVTRGNFVEQTSANFPAPQVPFRPAEMYDKPATTPTAAVSGPGAPGATPQDKLMQLLVQQGGGLQPAQVPQIPLPSGSGPSLGSASQAQGFNLENPRQNSQVSLAQLLGG